MKIEVTKAQLEAIKSLADMSSAVIGGMDEEGDRECGRCVDHVDRMLAKNNLKKRDFA